MNMMLSIRLLLVRAAKGLLKELYWSVVYLIDSLKGLALALVYFMAIFTKRSNNRVKLHLNNR